MVMGRRALPILMIVLMASFRLQAVAPNSNLNVSLDQYYQIKDALLKVIGQTASNPTLLNRAARLHKLQPTFGPETPFPCNIKDQRSPRRPQSVHRLRPGDIDVVGAIGDSLTAGNGITASTVIDVAIENRGVSWANGGQGTWREYLTLPNMLKEVNPNLVGFSLEDSNSHNRASQFNVAEPGAPSADLIFMAKELVKRIQRDPKVDVNNDWKLITLMIGSLDFCFDNCWPGVDPKTTPEAHRKHLIETFNYLKKMLPRTLIQLVITPNLSEVLPNFRGLPAVCYLLQPVECPCIIGLPNRHRQEELARVAMRWQRVQLEVASDPRYMDTDDFTVVAQPFALNITFPTLRDIRGVEVTDFTYLSQDCFHISQKSNARIANALWNNMLQAVGQKQTDWATEFMHFECPTKHRPYIFTNQNSRLYTP